VVKKKLYVEERENHIGICYTKNWANAKEQRVEAGRAGREEKAEREERVDLVLPGIRFRTGRKTAVFWLIWILSTNNECG
jgi:hypothetical protein